MTVQSIARRISNKSVFYILLTAVFSGLVYIAATSAGTYDDGDGLTHYLISRWSLSHPELLLDHWGKPLFTLVSSPFSQFGLLGITIFNIACGLIAVWCCYRISGKLGLNYTWTLIFLTCAMPVYFGVMNSGLVEPFFSMTLALCIMLVFDEKYSAAAIIASFLPFVRPEAYFVIPVFVLYFLLRKKFIHVALLATGTVIYSIIGYFVFDDILWVFTRTTYNEHNAGGYGGIQGELLHYVKEYEHIIGLPLAVLFVAGIVFTVAKLLRRYKLLLKKEKPPNLVLEEYLLLYGCLLSVVVAHSLLWGKGLFPTLGMYRYLGNILPLAAIVCLQGLNLLLLPLQRMAFVQYAVLITGMIYISRVPFQQYYYPFSLTGEQRVVNDAAQWLKGSSYTEAKIYYQHPFLPVVLDIDPFDRKKVDHLWAINKQQPELHIPPGSIVIWDAHFGPNEQQLPLDLLMKSPHYKLLMVFQHDPPFTVLGGYLFEVYVFQRL